MIVTVILQVTNKGWLVSAVSSWLDIQCNTTMPLISAFLTCSLYILSELETIQCYTYQTEPLFLSFSELAALEGKPSYQTNKPTSYFRDHNMFVVNCHEDSIEVVIKAYLFDPRLTVEPEHLRLGPVGAGQRHCTARVSANGEYIIRAPLTDCGSTVMVGEPLNDQNTKPVLL